ncbi:MAG: indole-3-glycerol phosphate synthase TrpC [Rikenellaceae bacterium]|jgi:indole-3-glycerol phosphate synthase|nr:indole-3-glycerol phosphate synthase TrpC [Rikenellaceae bacterium]
MNILDKILETKRAEMARARAERSFESLLEEARAVTRPVASFSQALTASPSGIIAEFKRRSPSKGFIKEGADVQSIVRGYAESGAAAISVLTDESYFGGGLNDLVQARAVTSKPLLRKDFVIDPYQICEARIAGADVILLIAAALTPEQCAELAAFARSLGLEVLLELHNEAELDHLNPDVQVVGVNNRDLTTFVTDTAVSVRMASFLPAGVVRISESGISDPEVVKALRREGYRGFLMGENFMKRPDPARALEDFTSQLSL